MHIKVSQNYYIASDVGAVNVGDIVAYTSTWNTFININFKVSTNMTPVLNSSPCEPHMP